MQKFKNIINCLEFDTRSQRKLKFEVVKYVFNYNSDDNKIIDDIIKKGKVLSEKVNPGAANFGVSQRSRQTIVNNSIAGLLAEYIWLDFINYHKIKCKETVFNGAKTQIDIELIESQKTIEVRSSFPKNGLKFALCHNKYQFDVIGPYINDYKPDEIKKDFYVRTLFPFKSIELMQKLKQDNFSVYLTGGATWEMIKNKNIAIEKDFIPEDELNISRLEKSSRYIVVPFSKALDTFEIVNEFKK